MINVTTLPPLYRYRKFSTNSFTILLPFPDRPNVCGKQPSFGLKHYCQLYQCLLSKLWYKFTILTSSVYVIIGMQLLGLLNNMRQNTVRPTTAHWIPCFTSRDTTVWIGEVFTRHRVYYFRQWVRSSIICTCLLTNANWPPIYHPGLMSQTFDS